ncbi:MAG: hypothetical protein KA220_07195 [Phenylobacterium sp.]|nr:hypothetical protein [Phenylobacterium sp.]MBP8246704.1 hypothetical protein [Phenylobacterium sp.]
MSVLGPQPVAHAGFGQQDLRRGGIFFYDEDAARIREANLGFLGAAQAPVTQPA